MTEKADKWLKVAQELCADLDNDVKDVAKRLRKWSIVHRMTIEEVQHLCDLDSSFMFNQIY